MNKYYLYIKNIIIINLKPIILRTYNICKDFLAIIAALFLFISWSDIGELSICQRLFRFIAIIILSLILSLLWNVFKKTNTIWENGTGKISIIYGDVFKIGFSKKNKENRIIVIPVNTHFYTIIDESIASIPKPLVSITTIHGQWLKKMFNNMTQDQLNEKIFHSLHGQGIPYDTDNTRPRGNKEKYPNQAVPEQKPAKVAEDNEDDYDDNYEEEFD